MNTHIKIWMCVRITGMGHAKKKKHSLKKKDTCRITKVYKYKESPSVSCKKPHVLLILHKVSTVIHVTSLCLNGISLFDRRTVSVSSQV